MKYKDFVDEVVKRLEGFYGGDAEITVRKVIKNNNQNLDGLHIVFKNEGTGITPILYLEEYYGAYLTGKMSIEECVGSIIDLRREQTVSEVQVQGLLARMMNWDSIKEDIYPMLVMTEDNQEMLDSLVHMEFLDLSVIYNIRIEATGMESAFVKVSNSLFEKYGITKEILHQQALCNMKKDGYGFRSMGMVISEMMNEELDEDFLESGIPMFIMTNKRKQYGAAGILDKQFLHEECLGKSFFIIPSSTHETIFVPDDNVEQDALDSMVREVNQTLVGVEERLSNHTYYYDSKIEEIRIRK